MWLQSDGGAGRNACGSAPPSRELGSASPSPYEPECPLRLGADTGPTVPVGSDRAHLVHLAGERDEIVFGNRVTFGDRTPSHTAHEAVEARMVGALRAIHILLDHARRDDRAAVDRAWWQPP